MSMPNHSNKPKRPRDVSQRAKQIVDIATGEMDSGEDKLEEKRSSKDMQNEKTIADEN